ncbi:MAG: hypothetical protein R3B67_11135 [Phycisphaerales bacterium]
MATQADQVARMNPEFDAALQFSGDGSINDYIETRVENPSDYRMEFTLTPTSEDSRWIFPVDHQHGLSPG